MYNEWGEREHSPEIVFYHRQAFGKVRREERQRVKLEEEDRQAAGASFNWSKPTPARRGRA